MLSVFIVLLFMRGVEATRFRTSSTPEPPSLEARLQLLATLLENTNTELAATQQKMLVLQDMALVGLLIALIAVFILVCNHIARNKQHSDTALQLARLKLEIDEQRNTDFLDERFDELVEMVGSLTGKVKKVVSSWPVQDHYHRVSALVCFVMTLKLFVRARQSLQDDDSTLCNSSGEGSDSDTDSDPSEEELEDDDDSASTGASKAATIGSHDVVIDLE